MKNLTAQDSDTPALKLPTDPDEKNAVLMGRAAYEHVAPVYQRYRYFSLVHLCKHN